LSCPDRNLAVFHHCRRYEGLRLLPSVCEQIIIQQTLINATLKTSSSVVECTFLEKHSFQKNSKKTSSFSCVET
ncbi:hypothetical protein ACTNDU_02940, partial [Hallella faecis]|uniref:hypothetical protein n=1 Tax=Hallella faecis TaxID=2841596 RepID=UPI003F8CA518